MKKGLKTLMLVLLVVPALLLVACSQSITKQEFSDRMLESAKLYYQEKDGKSMTITSSSVATNSVNEWVYYGEENENGAEKTVTTKMEQTQKIEIYATSINNERCTNIRVTDTSKVTTNAYRENEAETGVEAYTEIIDTVKVTTYVTRAVDDELEVKAYVSEKETIDGEAQPETKSVYTYLTAQQGANAIKSILEDVDDNIFADGFFTSELLIINLVGGNTEYTADGDKNFALKVEVRMPIVDDKAVIENTMNAELKFENKLPKQIVSKQQHVVNDKHVAEEGDDNSQKVEVTTTVTVDYSAGSISAPTGFEEATVAGIAPTIDVVGLNMNIGL